MIQVALIQLVPFSKVKPITRDMKWQMYGLTINHEAEFYINVTQARYNNTLPTLKLKNGVLAPLYNELMDKNIMVLLVDDGSHKELPMLISMTGLRSMAQAMWLDPCVIIKDCGNIACPLHGTFVDPPTLAWSLFDWDYSPNFYGQGL